MYFGTNHLTVIIIGSVYEINHVELTEYNLTTDKMDNEYYLIV